MQARAHYIDARNAWRFLAALSAATLATSAIASNAEQATTSTAIQPSAATAATASTTATINNISNTPPTAFIVGKVVTMDADDRVINNAVVIVRDGKIAEIGRKRDIKIPENAVRVERPDLWLVPGLVELHNHTAGALSDLNDGVYLTNPGLDSRFTVSPNTPDAVRAREGGVTTVLLIPGSGNNMSGFGTIVKFADGNVEDVILQSPGSIKVAQAGNPERYWYGVGRTFMNYNTRQTLERARDYHLAWSEFEAGNTTTRPAFDPAFDGFRGLFRREFVASVHTQQYQLVMTTVDMLANKLGIKTVLDHSTFDAWKVAPLVLEAGEENVFTICGPRAMYFDPTQRKIHGIVARWYQGGITKLGINTDSPVIPQEELTFQAAMACWFGYKPYKALAGLTRIGAEALNIENRVGTIEVGKDADFALWTGDPIDPRSACLVTVINGNIVQSDTANDRRF